MAIQVSGSTVIHDSQDVQVSGMFTASSFVGDASQLTNLPASGGTLEATASGTLADGSKVIVNSDGTVSAVAQTGEDYWIATLDGSNNKSDGFYGVRVDSSGNVYCSGYTYSEGAGSQDMILAKYNSSGTLQWQRILGSGDGDRVMGIVLDSSDNVYVCGYVAQRLLIAKYNPSGAIQWQRTLYDTLYTTGTDIEVDSSDNLYVSGYTAAALGGDQTSKALVAKYNSSGAIQWQRTLNNPNYHMYAYGLALDSSGNVYLAGDYSSSSAKEIFIAKYNNSGTLQWQRYIGGSGAQEGWDVGVDSSDNVYVIGNNNASGQGGADVLIAKYNSSGTIQWKRILGGTASDEAHAISFDSSDNVYFSGKANDSLTRILIAKYNSSGTIQWQRTFGGSTSGSSDSWGMTVSGSNVYVVGMTRSHSSLSTTGTAAIVVKLPNDGSLTGTYGSFTYATSSFTDANETSSTYATSSLTAATSTLTDTSSNYTDNASNLTQSTTAISSQITTLTSENYIGISNGAYSDGQTATIQVTGSVDDAQSGLTAGQAYYVQDNGTLGESGSVFAGTAVSASKIIVKG